MKEAVAQVIGRLPNLSRHEAKELSKAIYLLEAIEAAENVAGFEANRIMSVYKPSSADSLEEGVIYAARNAVLGILAKDSIPGDFFDSLVNPWVEVVGKLDLPESPDEVVDDVDESPLVVGKDVHRLPNECNVRVVNGNARGGMKCHSNA